MNTTFHIAEIIKKYFSGAITNEEQQQLEKWLSEDKTHLQMFQDFKRSGYVDEQLKAHQIFEVERGYRRFLQGKHRINRLRHIRRWAVVAAIVIPFVAGSTWFLFYDTPTDPSHEVQIAKIKPGSFHASLKLANGQQIELNDSIYTHINEEAGQITIQGQEINYSSVNRKDTLVYNTLSTPPGGEYRLILADGTRVWIGAATEFKYPVVFSGNTREVQIAGEAYFEVAKDNTKPFIVKTEYTDVKVLGTSFNIRAYQNEAEQTTLVQGQVEVITEKWRQLLTSGDQLNVQNSTFEIRKIKVQAYNTWKNQRFIFSDELLEDVVKKLERWYNIPFDIQDAILKQLRFTGNIPKYENLDEILKKLELTTRIHFVQKAGTILVMQDKI